MKKLKYIITTLAFVGFIFGVAIINMIKPDREFSDMENRKLQSKPEFSAKSFFSGDYGDTLEKYLADQMVCKDELVTLKTQADKLMLKSYQNGVYFGKDGSYLQDYQENKAQIDKNVNMLNAFAKGLGDDVSVNFMLVPNSISVCKENLPKCNKTDDQLKSMKYIENKLDKSINFYDPYKALKSSDSHVKLDNYYRTDHHWTSQGARLAFNGFMKSMGESVPKAVYSYEELKDFKGSLYSKTPAFGVKADTVSLPINKQSKLTVTYGTSGDNPQLAKQKAVTSDSLYVDEFKTQKDKYKTFLGGNFDIVNIESNGESDENVLILKDSYANTAMQYFADKYKHITMIDLRYYHLQEKYTVSEYIKKKGITKVIMLYNMDFINSDDNFMWLS